MANTSHQLVDLITYITKSLVDHTEQISVQEVESAQTNILELKVAKEDIGKIIGKNGRTADAIRTILSCSGAKFDKRYLLHIIDENDEGLKSSQES